MTAFDTTAGGTDTIVQAYEELRSHVLAGSPSGRHSEPALLLRQGPRPFSAPCSRASETLLELGRNRLEAELGVTMVLHTWTRELLFHPHVHCIVMCCATWGGTRTGWASSTAGCWR